MTLPPDEEPDFRAPIEPVKPGRGPWIKVISVLLVIVIVVTGLAGFGLALLRPVQNAPIATPSPSVTTAGGTGVRLAVIDGGGSLQTMDADGESISRYDVAGVQFSFPAWSPDGSKIAAAGVGGDGTGVYVFTVGSESASPSSSAAGASPSAEAAAFNPIAIYKSTDHPPFYLYWTPDSRAVTFLTTQPDASIDLEIAPADGSAQSTTISNGAPMYWTWVDNARLLVHSGVGPDAFVGEIGTDGTVPEDGLGPVDEPGQFRVPAVSSDGRFRAYVGLGSDRTPAVVVEPRGAAQDGERTEVPVLGPAALDFDPRGDRLAFIARSDPAAPHAELPLGPVRVIDATSGDIRTLVAGSNIAFFWSPDGRTIAALRIGSGGAPGTASVVAARGIREPSLRVAGGTAAAGRAAAATPGLALQLVFVDTSSGAVRSERSIRLADVFTSQVLPYFDQYALSHRLWSPDGASIALPVVAADDNTEIRIFPADGSPDTHVAAGVAAFWSP